ncbi:MAG: magnesium transporter [Candidatus Odinarchaeia archaeon]
MPFPPFIKEAKSAFISLAFNLGGIVSGTLLGYYLGIFTLTRWALIAFPGIMSVRGVIGGQFSGKMTSGLHVGFIKPTLTSNTGYFYKLLKELILLGFTSTLLLSVTNILFYYTSYGLELGAFIELFVAIQTTMALSLILVSPITAMIAILTFKKGLDPDKMTYPIVSTIADIVVAGVFVLSILIIQSLTGLVTASIIAFIFSIISIKIYFNSKSDKTFIKEFKTSLGVLVIVSFIVAVTGSVLEKTTNIIGSRNEIYVIYPAILDTVGDAGAIVGSTATTKLIIGDVNPDISVFKGQFVQIMATWFVSIILFTFYGLLSIIITGSLSLPVFTWLTSILLFTNILSIGVIMSLGLFFALATFKKELNPDSFVIPLQTNIADMLTTVILAFALLII